MKRHDDEPTSDCKVPGTTSCSTTDGRPTARVRHRLALVADNSARTTTVSGDGARSDPATHPVSGQTVRLWGRHLPSPSVRWVAAAKSLTEMHQRLGYLIRRRRV